MDEIERNASGVELVLSVLVAVLEQKNPGTQAAIVSALQEISKQPKLAGNDPVVRGVRAEIAAAIAIVNGDAGPLRSESAD